MRRWRPLTAVVAAVIVAVLAASPACTADHDIQVLSSQQLDSRLTELTLSTPALKKPTHVRVLLPDGYDGTAERPETARFRGCKRPCRALKEMDSWSITRYRTGGVTLPYTDSALVERRARFHGKWKLADQPASLLDAEDT